MPITLFILNLDHATFPHVEIPSQEIISFGKRTIIDQEVLSSSMTQVTYHAYRKMIICNMVACPLALRVAILDVLLHNRLHRKNINKTLLS